MGDNATMIAPSNVSDTSMICYTPTMTTTRGVWTGDNPLDYSLPLFILQLTLVVLATRFFVFILKPFHQPRVIAEIMGGLLLGPSVLGRDPHFANLVFPLKSAVVIETMANIGLIYFLFLVGLEMDMSIVRRTGKKALSIAVAGMILPFITGVGISLFYKDKVKNANEASYILYLGIVLAVTAFPVLARTLAELKLINTELGKLALSTSLINDVCAWVLLALAIALSEQNSSSWASTWVVLSNIVFVTFCFFVVRPSVSWLIKRTPDGKPFSEFQICIVLTGVMISAFITDVIGTHSIFGAFVYGLVIPNGPLGAAIIEKLEDFVSGLLLPLFYAISGLKTDINLIVGARSWSFVFTVIPLACFGKIAGTLIVSLLFDIPTRDGVVLGLLMNTKGLIEMIVLNIGREQKVLGDEIFSVMVVVTLLMTAVISPVVTLIYRPRKRLIPYKKRTVQSSRLDAELRVLVCIHAPRNVPTIINLLEATHPSKRSPVCAYVLHLVELTARASAMLVVHASGQSAKGPALNKTQAQSEHILTAFHNFEQHVGYVSVQPLTAVSPYSTMHEDICNLAEEKRVSVIIIPFHKQQTVDGDMQETNPALRMVNHNLLQNSPCSVGVLVDRGLNGSNRLIANQASHQVAVLFFGGPDDREALSYGWRMSRHPRVQVTVMHFIQGKDATHESKTEFEVDDGGATTNIWRENKLDEECINEIKMIAANDDSIDYIEKVVSNGEETVSAIRSMNNVNDLFIVGRGQGTASPLTEGLTDWSECPELGAIGDLLASTDFETTASVLVMHQYVGQGPDGEDVFVSERPWQSSENFNSMRQQHWGRYAAVPPMGGTTLLM